MAFAVSGETYDRFMGRYSRLLAPKLVELAGARPGLRAVDVGCGPGALASVLAAALGPEQVAAADPSEELVAACAERLPGADVRVAPAERLPWPDATFDLAFAQLVVNFMSDALAGVGEMRRVVRPGGVVAACTWDYRDGMGLLRTFWDAAVAVDPAAPDEGRTMRYATPKELQALWLEAGLDEVATSPIEVAVEYAGFDDFWEPFLGGTGPAGSYCVSLDPDHQAALREECRRRLGDPPGPFALPARAWAVRGQSSESAIRIASV